MAGEAFDIQLGMRHMYHPSQIVEAPFGIRRRDLRSHVYMVGKTGTGKTTLIKSIVSQAIAQASVGNRPPWHAHRGNPR